MTRLDVGAFGFESDEWLDHLREATEPPPLMKIGPYTLLREVSRGGQGIVYRAKREGFLSALAIKRLLRGSLADERSKQRFTQEIEAARCLDHPNIVNIHEVIELEAERLLAMDWVDGDALDLWATRLRRKRDPRAIVLLLIHVADAIHHAHQRGVIHRDLKPSNILVDEASFPHVLDFGLALRCDSDPEERITRDGDFLGTPVFASPEQIRGEDVDVRTDVYSFGVMMHQALTGTVIAAEARDRRDLLQACRSRAVATPMRGESPELAAIARRAMAFEPDRRYASMDALRLDLSRYLRRDPIEARLPSRLARIRVLLRRHRATMSLLAFVVGVFSISGAALWQMSQRSSAAAKRALHIQSYLEEVFLSATPERSGGELLVVDAIRELSARLKEEFVDGSDARGRLHATLGSVLMSLWRYREAAFHLRQAVALVDDDGWRSTALQTKLGKCLATLGSTEALTLLEDESAKNRAFESSALEAHSLLVEYANALWMVGDGKHDHKADRILTDIIGKSDDEDRLVPEEAKILARALESLGRFRLKRGALVEARTHLVDALELWRAHPSGLRSLGAGVLNTLALIEQRLGRYESARHRLEESTRVMSSSFGESWRPLLVWRMGRLWLLEGDEERARRCFREALRMACLDSARRRAQYEERLVETAQGLESSDAPLEASLELLAELGVFAEFHTTASYCHLSILQAREGHRIAAISLYGRALRRGLRADHPLARETLASIL